MDVQLELFSSREPYPTAAAEGAPQWPPHVPPAAMSAAVGVAVQVKAPAVVGQNSALGAPSVVAVEVA